LPQGKARDFALAEPGLKRGKSKAGLWIVIDNEVDGPVAEVADAVKEDDAFARHETNLVGRLSLARHVLIPVQDRFDLGVWPMVGNGDANNSPGVGVMGRFRWDER
jgi:hypothetical protein